MLRWAWAVATYQRKDHYHQRAKREGLRSRAAYKLAEIDRGQSLLRRGAKVIDLGCWPGGWLQVAAKAVGPEGRVVGVDRVPLDPPLTDANVRVLCGDLADADLAVRLREALGSAADLLLSDAAPRLTGVRATDRANEERLLEAVEGLIPGLLRPGGDLLLKILDSPEAEAIARRIRSGFDSAKTVRPRASRKGSSERYLLARGFRAGASSNPGEPR